MKNSMTAIALTASIMMLSACGSDGDAATEGAAETAATTNDWDATDACALLDKAAVGAALNDPVTETSLAFVNQASGPNAATSECTYRLTSGGTATLMARRSPIADNTPEAIAIARKGTQETLAAFGDATIEDVDGLGKAAFYVPRVSQMNVFIDDDKFVILTLGTAPAATAKATAVELVGKIGA